MKRIPIWKWKKRKLFALKSLLPRKVVDLIRLILNTALNKYDSLLSAGDLNTNILRPNHFSDLNYTFSLTNLVTDSTCFKSNKAVLIDLMLTNKLESFYKSHSFVTDLSDCHKLVVITPFQRLPPKFVTYRNQNNFHESNFFHDFDSRLAPGELCKKIY